MDLAVIIWGSVSKCVPPKKISHKSKALCLHMLYMLSKEKKFSLISSSATEEIQWFYQAIPNVLHDNGECTFHKTHFWNCKGGFAMYLGIFFDKIIVDAHKSCSPVQAIDLCTNICNLCIVIICKLKLDADRSNLRTRKKWKNLKMHIWKHHTLVSP